MAGNNSKPLQLVKGHRTKAEIEYREKAEKAMQTKTEFKPTPAVKSDPVALKEFKRLKKLYGLMAAEFVDGLDEGMVNRYCLLISQEQALLGGDFQELHKTREMLIKIEDRLFLNPSSRVKAIPKKPQEDQQDEDPMAVLFGRRDKP